MKKNNIPYRLRLSIFFVIFTLLPFIISGCGFGTRYIFNANKDILATPDQVNLRFQEVWFPAADGTMLHGWFVPSDPDSPLVVFFHGNAANITHRVDNLLHLNNLGLSVFIFDYRGYGASEGRPLHEKDLYLDAQGALSWLTQEGWELDRMIFYGRSMGAAVALQAALEAPPAGLVLECPFTNLSEIARAMTPVTYYLLGWWSINARFDNLTKISQLERPLLVIHGEQDKVVPWAMGKTLYERAPEPKRFHSVPEAGHSDAFLVGGEAYSQAWLDFIQLTQHEKASSRSAPKGLSSP
ncbi:alpha/beta hydrolase [Geoalkalibacter halelectricus]|uniref:Alpha/beta hydrolase n=1 Tax=Geoalkalibacter halelectricus TaxID=2847045 RepID=A0ABY5ZSJ4_9BACT|nr:alpha/beta hydrolase [Geoalkalibacter halelectricus]MDO3379839.1 alpha/beta hydrolase [Geoalkalibacter halelectricus]UWZ80629.1 alpha/beta hydrolase [Geoalkalibacter halelectricus]